MSSNELSTVVVSAEDRALLDKAQELLDLLKRAHQLGWTLTLPPEQMKTLIDILENADLEKRR